MAVVSRVEVALETTKATANAKKFERSMDGVASATRNVNRATDQTKRKTATATANVQRFGIAFRSVLGPVVAITGAMTFLNKSLNVFAERQADANLLAAGLKKIGAATGDLEKFQAIASDLGEQTLFNQEDFTQGFALLTSFRAIGQDSFKRVATAAADMAATTKQDVNSSLLQLAKALENPVEGMSALSRSGTTFTQVQKDIVKGLVESNKTFEAQTFILDLVEDQYKGNARAAAVGLAGAQDTLSESVRDFNEVVGQIALGPAIAATNTLTGLFKQATSELTEWNKAFGKLSQLLGPVTGGIDLVGQSIKNTTELFKFGIPGLSATVQLYERIIALRGLLNEQGELPGTSEDARPEQGAALDPEAVKRFRRQLELEDLFKGTNKAGSGGAATKQRVDMSQKLFDLNQRLRKETELGNTREAATLKLMIKRQRIAESNLLPIERENKLAEATFQFRKEILGIDSDQLKRYEELRQAAESLGTTVAEDWLKKQDELAAKSGEKLKTMYESIGQSITTGIVDSLTAAVEGTKTLADVASQTLRQVANILLQFGVNTALGGIPGLGDFFKAKGGPVSGGSPYMVGEKGPELFVPNTSGTIVPNNKLGGGGGGSTNVVVNVDAKGSSASGDTGAGKQLGGLIGAAVQAELIKQQRPGGLLSR